MKIEIIILFAFIYLPNLILGQINEYESKEKEEYWDSQKWNEFKPVDKSQILRYYHSSLNFIKTSEFKVYVDTLDFTPYQDSVHTSLLKSENTGKMWNISTIANIDKYDILKYESSENMSVILYQSFEFEDINFGEPGIWIAISLDNEETWEYLYTGLVQKQPLFLKWYSVTPFILSETKLQIDGCFLRQMSRYSMPVSLHSYEIVQDGVGICIDLNELRKDSDNDGLTDIFEKKIFTDALNPDTDSDGILDGVDLNPRKDADRTEKTIVYERVIEEELSVVDTILFNDHRPLKSDHNEVVDSTETIFIISDMQDIYSVSPKSKRVIILSTEEYNGLKSIYNDGLNKMVLSPFFKVDKTKDVFILSTSIGSSGEEYLIEKSETAWILKMILSWIS